MVTEHRLAIYIRLSAPFKERVSQREFTLAQALGILPMSITKSSKAKLKRMGLGINYAKRVASAEFSKYYSL